MNVTLKLYGTLPDHYQGPYDSSGLKIDLVDGATIADLADATGIPRKRIGLASINGRLAKAEDTIPDLAEVKFMPSLAGG